jgi:hypothetical protein
VEVLADPDRLGTRAWRRRRRIGRVVAAGEHRVRRVVGDATLPHPQLQVRRFAERHPDRDQARIDAAQDRPSENERQLHPYSLGTAAR